jgi:transposase-like protein
MSKRSGGNNRFSSKRKTEAVLRLLRGEDLELVSREYKVTAATLSQWRDAFLAGGQSSLQHKEADLRDDQIQHLHSKVGELTMANDLLEHKIERLERGLPLADRSSKP